MGAILATLIKQKINFQIIKIFFTVNVILQLLDYFTKYLITIHLLNNKKCYTEKTYVKVSLETHNY